MSDQSLDAAPQTDNADIVARADKAAETLQNVKTAIGKVIYGQHEVIDQA